MINEERLLKVLLAPHVSEKATLAAETNNTVVLKVVKDANKEEIKAAVEKLFEVEVDSVRTLNVKGKTKRHGHLSVSVKTGKKLTLCLKKVKTSTLLAAKAKKGIRYAIIES